MTKLPWDPFFDDSRHNPIYDHRNHNKRLEIETILSKFRTQLCMAQTIEDQAAFDDLYKRITKAGEGLELIPPQGEDLYSKTMASVVDKSTRAPEEASRDAK